jgi:hypothetical protein
MLIKKISVAMLILFVAACSNNSGNDSDAKNENATILSNLDSLTSKSLIIIDMKPGASINQSIIFKDTSYQKSFKIKDLFKPSWLIYDSITQKFSSKTLSVDDIGTFQLLFNWQSKNRSGSIVKNFTVTKWNSSITWQARVGNTRYEYMTADNSKIYAQSVIKNVGSLILPNDSLPSSASETKYFAFFANLPEGLKTLGDSLKLKIKEFRSYSNTWSRFGLKSVNNTSFSIEVYTMTNKVGGNFYFFYPTKFVSNLNGTLTTTTINNYSNIASGFQIYVLKTSPNNEGKVFVSSYVDGDKKGTISNINLTSSDDKFSSIFCEFMAGFSNAQNEHKFTDMQLNTVELTLNNVVVYSTDFND